MACGGRTELSQAWRKTAAIRRDVRDGTKVDPDGCIASVPYTRKASPADPKLCVDCGHRMSNISIKLHRKRCFACHAKQAPRNTMPEFDHLPNGKLRQSQVELYLSCPHAYYLQHVERYKSLTSPPLLEGTSVHKVLETNNIEKAKSGDDLPVDRFQELWDDTWASNKGLVDQWFATDPDEIQTRGRALVAHYRKHKAGDITPWSLASIEKPVEGSFGGIPMVGTVDLINAAKGSTDEAEKKPQILDFKTVKAAKNQSDLDCSIQLGVYAELTGIRDVAYVSLCKTKDPKIVTVSGTRTERSIERTKTVVKGVSEAIKAGAFPYADPNSWKCSPQYCGVWYACKQGAGDK